MSALEFEWEAEARVMKLRDELQAGSYTPSRSICFALAEPAPREIFAAAFRDRVIHHLLVREVQNVGEKAFIYDSYACREGKGTHKAIKRLRTFLSKVSANGRRSAYYIQLDIAGFFMSIDQKILFALFKKLIERQPKPVWRKKEILALARTVIFHAPTEKYVLQGDRSLFDKIPARKSLFAADKYKGLPIGNYSSQFFANLYMNELDQFIKRELGCSYYLRYVDDFILLDQDKGQLLEWRDKIAAFLPDKLSLELSWKKEVIEPIDAGIDFLGYFVKPEYALVRRKVVRRLHNKIQAWKDELASLSDPEQADERQARLAKITASLNSYWGHFRHAQSFRLRRDIWERHLGELKKYLAIDDAYSTITYEPE